MDYAKVQMEAIKAQILRDSGDVTAKVAYDDMDGGEFIGLTASAYHFYIIPRHSFYLDAEKFESCNVCQRTMDSAHMADQLMYTGMTKQAKQQRKKGTRTVIVLHTEDGEEVWLDEKIVKKFGNPAELTYFGQGAKYVVYIQQNDCYLGAIMPVNHK